MKRGPAIAAIVASLFAAPALALDGRVLDARGRPVRDATVFISGRPGTARTDAQGRFTWKPDPRPPFRVVVVLADGQPSSPVLVSSIPSEGPLIVTLDPLGGESVIVTAEGAPHIEAPPAAATETLAQEDLNRRAPERLVDALENLPGAGRVSQGHDAVPSLRGLARGRTLILLDEGRVRSERRAGPNAAFLDPFFLGSVEVSRGPGSVAYGSDAFGGVIHARSRRPVPGSPLAARVLFTGGSGVPSIGGGVEVSRGFDEGGVLVQARARGIDDYDSPSGTIPNSSAGERGLLARFDHEAGPGVLSLGWRADFVRDAERPTNNSDEVAVTRPREDSRRASVSYEMDPLDDATMLAFHGFVGTSRLITLQDRAATSTRPRSIDASDVRATDFGFRARAVRPLERARVEVGLDLNGRLDLSSEETGSAGSQEAIEDADYVDTALHASGEFPLSRALSLSTGLRADRITTRNRGGLSGDRSTRDEALSGFAALTAGSLRGVTLTGQVSRGFRVPTLSDLYFTGISGRGFITGEPDLDPETSLQFDAAARYAARRWRAALYVYRYRIDDLIERFQQGRNASGQDLFFFRNRGEARLQGVELEVRADLGAGFSLEAAVQSAAGETKGGTDLDDVPVESLTVQIRQDVSRRGYWVIRGAFVDRDEDPGPTERVTPGHATYDVGGGLSLGPRVDARATVRNLLDQEHLDGFDQRTVPAEGRSVFLSLTIGIGGGPPN